MEKKYVNPEALELDNQELERAMDRYMEEKTPGGLVADVYKRQIQERMEIL